MNQLILGAAIPFAACLAWYAARRGRASLRFLVAAPLLMAASAAWAVVPDIPRLLGHQELYLRWARDPRMNLFWWHYHIDEVEGVGAWPQVLLVAMCLCLLAAAWRELQRREAG